MYKALCLLPSITKEKFPKLSYMSEALGELVKKKIPIHRFRPNEFREDAWESLWSVFLFVVLKTGSHYVAQASLKLTILLPQPPECWD
jgi:hypothetical protein